MNKKTRFLWPNKTLFVLVVQLLTQPVALVWGVVLLLNNGRWEVCVEARSAMPVVQKSHTSHLNQNSAKKIPQDLKIYELYRSDGVSNAYQARLTVELFQLYESVWSLKGGVNGDRMHQPSLHRPNQQNNSCDPRAAHIHATLRSYTVNNAQMDIQMYIFLYEHRYVWFVFWVTRVVLICKHTSVIAHTQPFIHSKT